MLTVLTHILFDGMVEKPLVPAFQNVLWIENQLNIKKVMGRNVWMRTIPWDHVDNSVEPKKTFILVFFEALN